MSEKLSGSGTCCLPNEDDVTYLQIGPRRVTVGMMGLETVFMQLFLLGRRSEEASDAELVGLTRKFNYIPDRPNAEADYGITLRQAYVAFYAGQEKNHD